MKSCTSVKDGSLPFPNDETPVVTDQSNSNSRRLSVYTVPEPYNGQQNNDLTRATFLGLHFDPANQFASNVESDLMKISLSLISLVFDTSCHIWTACELWKNPSSYELFVITTILIIAPSLFINGLSLYNYCKNYHISARYMFSIKPVSIKKWFCVHMVVHTLQLGQLYRYMELIFYIVKSQRRSKWERIGMEEETEEYLQLLPIFEREVAKLEVYHGVLESAPQFIFHLYSLVTSENNSMIVAAQISSLPLSLISISWALMSMEKGIRYMDYPEEQRLNMSGSAILFLSNFFRLTSRFTALVLFATVSKLLLLQLFVAHMAVTVITGIWYFHIFLKELEDLKDKPLNSTSEIGLRDRILRKMLSQLNVLGEPNSDLTWIQEKITIETPWLSWLVFAMFIIVLIIQVIFIVTGVLLAIIGYFVYFPFAIGFPRNIFQYSLYAFILVVGAAENVTMIVFWYIQPENVHLWYHFLALVTTCLTFVIGVIFLQLYNFLYRPPSPN